MSDVLIAPGDDGESYDLILFDGDVVRDESLRGAIIVSLFTDAEDADLTTGERRGWWADALNADPTDRIGSKLWLLRREKETSQVLNSAKTYAEDALAWMLADGVCSQVVVSADYGAPGQLDLTVDLDGPTGPQQYKFADLWAANFADPLALPDRIADETADIAARLSHLYYDPTELPELA